MAPSTYLSFFAGVGGFDLAARICWPKSRCLGYVEIGIEAAEVLDARIEEGSLDEAPIFSDVRTFPCDLYRGRVAAILAGFPCPDYSVAGKRAGIVGKHGQLWWDLHRVIREVEPEWVRLENVPGLLTADGERFPCVCGWSDRWGGFPDGEGRREERPDGRGPGNNGVEGCDSSELSLPKLRRQPNTDRFKECEAGGHDQVVDVREGTDLPDPSMATVLTSQERASRDLFRTTHEEMAAVQRERPGYAGSPSGIQGGEKESRVPESEGTGSPAGGLCCTACGEPLDGTEGRSLRGAMGDVLWSLSELGFTSEWLTLRASDVGASHGRNRWFCIARRRYLAHRQSGRFGELREPSRSNGFADWSNAELGHAAGDHERRDTVPGIDGPGITVGGSGGRVGNSECPRADTHTASGGSREAIGEPSGQLADDTQPRSRGVSEPDGWQHSTDVDGESTKLADPARHERAGSHGEAGARRGVCEASEGVADAGDGLIPQPGRGPEGRDGIGSAEPVLANTTDDHGRRGISGEEAGTRPNGIGRRGSSGQGLELGNPNIPRLEGRNERGYSTRERIAGPAVGELADAERESGSTEQLENTRERPNSEENNRSVPGDPGGIPLFAPGPGATELWQRILREYPELAPAISQEEIESCFRLLATRDSAWLDFEDRTDQLRALGNLVCPVQAAAAITMLSRRYD